MVLCNLNEGNDFFIKAIFYPDMFGLTKKLYIMFNIVIRIEKIVHGITKT